ncbi:MAG: GPP34 family phosphoprotein [Clostridiales bacterium]|jgi:hypothetical protein|nr:GPP34 family phosphoprotein [Clostridiales bacterium]
MSGLSFTQEFFLCAVNKKGDIPAFSATEIVSCLVAGGIAELETRGLIVRNANDKLAAAKEWDGSLPYLKPLYDRIASFKKPKDASDAAEPFVFSLTNKKLDELLSAVRESLYAAECLDERTGQGLLKNKTKYPPKADAAERVIKKVRAEFLGDGAIPDQTVCLVALLDKSGIIKNYFSKVESEKFKGRLKEIRKSDTYTSVKRLLNSIDELSAAVVIAVVD